MIKKLKQPFAMRRQLLMLAIFSVFVVLFGRALQLQLLHADFYQQQGSDRRVRVVEIPAYRGLIKDRNDNPLAISTPVYSVWADPQKALENSAGIEQVAQMLNMKSADLIKKLSARKDKRFVYIKRHVLPDVVKSMLDKKISGIDLKREYRRYYPAGEMSSHLVGLTNIDDQGLEGVELAYDDWLRGVPGKKRVLIDGTGTVISNIDLVQEPRHGKDLLLSIDRRIQYMAYRELKKAVLQHGAKAGSVVVLSVGSGEVLGVANYPSLNPNNRAKASYNLIRNRAITDVFEPGSTIKPFLVAAALDTGKFKPTTQIDTSPGYYQLGATRVSDFKNYGLINVSSVLSKSSNVGAVLMALKIDEENVWDTYQKVGFGKLSGSGFPGERAGELVDYTQWNKSQRATLSYGYGMSTTTLQLARAYSVLASDGILRPLTFLYSNKSASAERVMSARTTKKVRQMLEGVVSEAGTGSKAIMQGYTAAGKTGTSRKIESGQYVEDKHLALFAGMAPAAEPKVVVVVVIDQPSKGGYYGGAVAAPVFASITESALRLMNVPPQHSDKSIRDVLITEAKH